MYERGTVHSLPSTSSMKPYMPRMPSLHALLGLIPFIHRRRAREAVVDAEAVWLIRAHDTGDSGQQRYVESTRKIVGADETSESSMTFCASVGPIASALDSVRIRPCASP